MAGLDQAIGRTVRAFDRQFERRSDTAAISARQYALLQAIDEAGPVTLSELAERLALDNSTLTRSLKRMCEHGWVSLVPHADRRVRCAVATDAGRTRLQLATQAWARIAQDLTARLGVDTLTRVDRLLDRVDRSLCETSDPRSELPRTGSRRVRATRRSAAPVQGSSGFEGIRLRTPPQAGQAPAGRRDK
ncbi:MarR family transcriptional regulator [Salinisphaera sp. T31B1]|uniref:MarR family winged helix-turn-helix transcriptional regulator n=1 Tax=Salinisphaera sp. T31B1 TaxID=727963 RepID=UPI00333E7C36